MRVAVIGTGHVGLVKAATQASFGHDVAAVDTDAEKIDMLSGGEPPFFEPGLAELVEQQVAAGRSRSSTRVRWSCTGPRS